MSKIVAVLGVGSAGIQSLCHMLSFLGPEWSVMSIHDPKIASVGVGESTNESFGTALEYGLDFNYLEDLQDIDGTVKLCTKWVDWKETPFTTPLLNGALAMHFNTFKIRDFAMPRLHKKWGNKLCELHGTIKSVTQDDNKVYVEVDDSIYYVDYVIDCRGFPETFEEYNCIEDLAVNQCMVHSVDDVDDWRYTLHQATPDGWMFGIPLTSRTSYGYLFNNTITSPDQAKENFSKQINVPVESLKLSEFKFRPYYAKKVLDGRILKNGNKAVFFEPMFANSIFLYDRINKLFIDHIYFNDEERVNKLFAVDAEMILLTFHYFYQGGSIYNTPFWERIKAISTEIIANSQLFYHMTEQLNRWNITRYGYTCLDNVTDRALIYTPQILYRIDKSLGYNYWTPKE